ncbi:MAG: tRNA (adenosine(37)-N6)-dimethylallyltransferase MiaA [Cyclobacteriaceae bacterium]|nr:tRNA (adenosine(37)-N6)-dimethylallyltransferase MiaA [Cyclobacteriaceae bacterium]
MQPRTLLVLVGPTAVGKTAVAIRLASHFHTEVVSADSRQVFREMEIGTAKPSPADRAKVRHHFIDTLSITEAFDAGQYGEEALKVINSLFEAHRHAVLCGGSGLYIKALLEGFDDMPDIPPAVRQAVSADYRDQGLEGLQKELEAKDPDYYEVVDRRNPQRLMRALEVIRHTGKPFSAYRQKTQRSLPFNVIKLGLDLDREELYHRIDQRMDAMIAAGLFEEASRLFPLRHLPALQTVGYQEIFGFLEGKYDREEAVRLLKRNSRRYAKRQLTWFRRDPEIRWFHPDEFEAMVEFCEEKTDDS